MYQQIHLDCDVGFKATSQPCFKSVLFAFVFPRANPRTSTQYKSFTSTLQPKIDPYLFLQKRGILPMKLQVDWHLVLCLASGGQLAILYNWVEVNIKMNGMIARSIMEDGDGLIKQTLLHGLLFLNWHLLKFYLNPVKILVRIANRYLSKYNA